MEILFKLNKDHFSLQTNLNFKNLHMAQRRPIDPSKATCLSVISIACSPASNGQFFETVTVDGRVMPHPLVHPFEIHGNFPK